MLEQTAQELRIKTNRQSNNGAPPPPPEDEEEWFGPSSPTVQAIVRDLYAELSDWAAVCEQLETRCWSDAEFRDHMTRPFVGHGCSDAIAICRKKSRMLARLPAWDTTAESNDRLFRVSELLMDFILPGVNVPLGNATAEQIAASIVFYNDRIKAANAAVKTMKRDVRWLTAVQSKVPKKKAVRDVLDDTELRSLRDAA